MKFLQIQDKSQKRDEEQAENIKKLNNLLIENRQKTIDLENSNEVLIKENESLEMDKNNFNKNLIKANEHNKHLSKELKEEKIKKLEEMKNLTDQLNEKQLEINKLQHEYSIDDSELKEKTQRIRDLKVKLEEYEKNENFGKKYLPLLVNFI